MSFFSSLGSAIADLLPTIHAEEVAEPEAAVVESSSEEAAPAEAEEEEEDEPEDLAPGIREACASKKPCSAFKHHFDECTERITEGRVALKGEDCVEELFHFMHCVDDCAAANIFASLK